MQTQEARAGAPLTTAGTGPRTTSGKTRGVLTADDILGHPDLHGALRHLSQLLLQIFDTAPRLAAVFATQQRWLMAQAALGLHFRLAAAGQSGGLTAARFFETTAANRVASRNTADAFLKEMVKYGYATRRAGAGDRRTPLIEPTAATVGGVRGWLMVHLSTLDRLDGRDGGGRRLSTFIDTPEALAAMHPAIADGLLSSRPLREPGKTLSLFSWLDNGGLVMDRLIAGMAEPAPGAERIPIGTLSISAMAVWLKLSRTHLATKLRDAESMGSIGWLGKRGHSVMWISDGFRREYAAAQAVKLAIIDAAFDACFASGNLTKNRQLSGGIAN